jgi:S1-C subfamily serine protease
VVRAEQDAPPAFPPPPGGWPTQSQPPFGWAQTETVSTEAAGHPRRRRRALAAVVAALVLLTAGIGIGWSISSSHLGNSDTLSSTPITPVPQRTAGSGSTATLSPQAVAQRVEPAVVDVTATLDMAPLVGSQGNQGPSSKAAGTGMIITSTGEILTNNHVVEGSTKITVTRTTTGQTYSAHVAGVSTTGDVALLQIDGSVSGLPTVELADSSQLSVGQSVVAIGNALGKGGLPSVSSGNVTALGRSINVSNDNGGTEHLSNLIQMDARISPGDSGGPLVNRSGQVVGIITAASRSQSFDRSSTNGFAIPIDDAVAVVNLIRAGHEGGGVIIGQAGFLGVEVSQLTPQVAQQRGLPVDSGVLVEGVIAGTPAAKVGMARNVVITQVNGKRVTTVDGLGSILHSFNPGDHVTVTWVDGNGSTHSSSVALTSGPAV